MPISVPSLTPPALAWDNFFTLTSAQHCSWSPDILGPGFEQTTLSLGTDPDAPSTSEKSSPEPVSVLVRYKPENTASDNPTHDISFEHRPAILMVHGMTDYFFHDHVARFLHDAGYAVYGIDLRKAGRAHRDGQTWHHVSSQRLYDQELTKAASIIAQTHPHLVVEGHSKGGLAVAGWAQLLSRYSNAGNPDATLTRQKLSGILLNSPWLDLQAPKALSAPAKILVPLISKLRGDNLLPGGLPTTYGQSLSATEQGAWDYNLEYKPVESHDKSFSWLNSVIQAQKDLHSGKYSTEVPTLILSSDKKYVSPKFTVDVFTADIVLWPEHMQKWAKAVNPEAVYFPIQDAIHDVYLSGDVPRQKALDVTAQWLSEIMPVPSE